RHHRGGIAQCRTDDFVRQPPASRRRQRSGMVAGATDTQSQSPRHARPAHSYGGSQMNKVATQPATKTSKKKIARSRLLIEEWLPAQAIGVECMRERGSASALAPTTFIHVWWA